MLDMWDLMTREQEEAFILTAQLKVGRRVEHRYVMTAENGDEFSVEFSAN